MRAAGATVTDVTAARFTFPFYGAVSAGPLVEAVEGDERVGLGDLFGDDAFAVRVRGDVFAPQGVRDGDYLVLRPLSGRRDAWKTVAAEVGGTLGLYDYVPARAGRPQPDSFRLMPRAARPFAPAAGPGDGVRVLGAVVGILHLG